MILYFIPGPPQLIQALKVAQHLGGARGDTSKGIVQKIEGVSSKKGDCVDDLVDCSKLESACSQGALTFGRVA